MDNGHYKPCKVADMNGRNNVCAWPINRNPRELSQPRCLAEKSKIKAVNKRSYSCLDSMIIELLLVQNYFEKVVEEVFSHSVLNTCSHNITAQLGLFLKVENSD